MAEHSCSNGEGEVRKPFFAEIVHTQWIHAINPNEVLVDTNLRDVVVHESRDLNAQVPVEKQNEIRRSWLFEIAVEGTKVMTNVALSLDCNRENFIISSVASETVNYPNLRTQEWVDSPLNGIEMGMKTYHVEIDFKANSPGTYRQHILFGFSQGPAVRRQLCVDCILKEDIQRLEAAKEYLLYLTQRKISEHAPIVPFESPQVAPSDLRDTYLTQAYPEPVLDSFRFTHSTLKEDGLTLKNYRGRLHELICVEELARREQIAKYNEMVQMNLTTFYSLTSDTDGSSFAKFAATGELFAQMPLGREVSEDTKSGRLLLRSCSKLLVRLVKFNQDSDPTPKYGEKFFEAHIEDKCNHSIYVRLSETCVEEMKLEKNTEVKMHVQFVMDRLPFCEWHRALDSLTNTKLIFPDTHYERATKFEWSNEWETDGESSRLNDKQKEAVAVMMAPRREILPPILILGPFGTGKTSTIAQALKILLLNNLQSKVVLCTQSNSAADLYVKEFFDAWLEDTKNTRLKPIRIYYKGRARNTVHPIVRKYSLMDLEGNFRSPTKEDLEYAGLVISTLATSSCLMPLDFNPTHVVIDEAAQALECEVLTALALANSTTRVILAGDQMQLAPEVYSDLARERGFGMSLLERIHLRYAPKHPCRIQLCRNYRAHADIVRFTSELFYGGEIEPGALIPKHPTQEPLTFYAVQGEVCQGANSTGYFNNDEAMEIAERVSELKKFWPVDHWGPYGENSIGVVAHYSEQVGRIRHELRKRRLFDVSVERVLNVQGKQFTAVFISVVRTSRCCRYAAERNLSDYGFLTNPRLLNTAVTRAKSLVAVVGDPVALLTIGSCSRLWYKFLQMAGVYGVTKRELDNCIREVMELPVISPLNPLAQEFIPRNTNTTTNSYWLQFVPNGIHCPSPTSNGTVNTNTR